MKFQLNVNYEVLKKSFKYFVLQIIFTLISLYLFFSKSQPTEAILAKYLSFIGVPSLENFNSLHLIMTYNLFFIMYIYINFFNYEKFHSYENMILRFNPKVHYLSKTFLAFLITVILSVVYFTIIYLSFKKYIPFEVHDIFNLVLYQITMLEGIYTISFKYKNRPLIAILTFILTVASIVFYKPLYCIIWITLLFIYNLTTMNFKNTI